jgi:predicted Fe-S protein YdhL (DUF1289 family)
MPTPCRNLCRLDAAGIRCRDCGRTLDEIAAWGGLDAATQAAIIAELPARLAEATRRHQHQQQQQ